MATTTDAETSRIEAYEKALVGGDLTELTAEERVAYYRRVCESLGLNYLSQPFAYIQLLTGAEGARVRRLVLYAKKDATDQLRRINRVSIDKPEIRFEDEWILVTVVGHTQDGRSDADIGVVSRKDMRGDFGNAVMKAVTKAKRRLTLSLCGLGWLDETEVDSIPEARVYTDLAGQVELHGRPAGDEPSAPAVLEDPVARARRHFWAEARKPQYDLWEEGMPDPDFVRAVHRALGLPEEPGALADFARTYGWDVARQMLEDGARLPPEMHEDEPLPDVSEADFWQAVGPDGLGLTWRDVRAALGIDPAHGRVQTWIDAGHTYAEAKAIVERSVLQRAE